MSKLLKFFYYFLTYFFTHYFWCLNGSHSSNSREECYFLCQIADKKKAIKEIKKEVKELKIQVKESKDDKTRK